MFSLWISRRALAATALALAASLPARAADTGRDRIRIPEPVPVPVPSPTPPPRLAQDDLDLQARSNVVQGSGARAFGMGGAFLARADDATAASWNPAGLSYLRRPELSLSWAALNRFTAALRDPVSGAQIADDRRRGSAPDFLAVTFPFALRSITGAWQLSFQRVIPFGGHRTIDRPDTPRTVDSDGGFDVLALGSGWQLSRKVRLGATLNRWFGGYHQTREGPTTYGSTQQVVDFDLSGWNVHLGLIVSPREDLNLGIVAKTPFTGHVKLHRSRVDTSTILTSNEYTSNEVRLDFPGAVGAGLSWRPRSALTLSLDYTRTYWSKGTIRNFFTLQRNLDPNRPVPGPTPEAPDDVFEELPYPVLYDPSGNGQTDTQQTRVGVEYVVIGNRLKVPLRAGYFSDAQYFRTVRGSPPRFDGWTAGTGLIAGPVLLDVAYVYESGRYVALDTSANPVRNTVRAHRVFASLIYRHGGSR